MSPPVDLIKAIRTGLLSEVIAALDAGASVELNDGQGDPGLPLAIACFKGYADIVRELVARGARLNFADNRAPTSPLVMAIRAGKSEVVKALIELGAEVPPDLPTGLSDQELKLALWKAQMLAASASGASGAGTDFAAIEEIQVVSCYGTDTGVLDAEMRRAIDQMCKK